MRLRTRVTLFFSLTALVASLALAVVTYAVARNYLLDQRTSVAKSQAFNNAKSVRDELLRLAGDVGDFVVEQLRTEGAGFAVVLLPGQQPITTDFRFQPDVLPPELLAAVRGGTRASSGSTLLGQPYLAVGVYIAAFDASYFEAFPLRTPTARCAPSPLRSASAPRPPRCSPAALGWWTNRRLLRPLTRVAAAAGDIASGGLDTRMPAGDRSRPRPAGRRRSTRWPTRCRPGSNARPGSRPTSATSCARRSPRSPPRSRCSTPARRPARPQPAGARRGRHPGAPLRPDGDGPARAVAHRRRLDGAAPRGGQPRRADLAASPTATASATCRSRSAARCRRRCSLDKLRFERVLANLLENASQHGGGPTRVVVDRHGRRGIVLGVEDAGRASPEASGRGSSSASPAAAPAATASAPGSGCRSSPSTRRRTAARRGSRTAPAAARGSW